MFVRVLACLLLANLGAGLALVGDHPCAALLIEAPELAKPEVTARCCVLDARSGDWYRKAHIAGALWVDYQDWAAAFTGQPKPAAWEKKIGALGIDADTPVVVYDNGQGKSAAHVWWMLRYWGVKDVRPLNGGFYAWTLAGAAQQQEAPRVAARAVRLRADTGRSVGKKEMLELARSRAEQILDARTAAEFRGEVREARRGGAIPSARHLAGTEMVDPKTWHFRSPEELTRLFRAAGVDPAEPAVTYCHSGERAALLAFGLELMGATQVRLYLPGWSEWGNAGDTPVARGAGAK
jgi:thiosulfate/3-mercaptopyruvate sulfurtransferase